MKTKRIAFVINGMGPGGSQRNVANLANYFVDNNNEVTIICLSDNLSFYELSPKIVLKHFIRPKKKKILNIAFWKKNIKKACKNDCFDYVIAIGLHNGLLCAYSKLKRTKLIIRGTSSVELSVVDKLLLKFFRKDIDAIVAQTKAQFDLYPNSIKNKIHIISNPFPIKKENNNKNGFFSKRIISIGRLNLPVKHQDIMIEGFAIFSKKYPSFELHLYGSPQLNDGGATISTLNKICLDNGVENSVFIHPATPNIYEVQKDVFAFICASSFEGMPNAMIECMLNGVPCISTKWLGSDEIIIDNLNGFLIEMNSPNQMAKCLENLLDKSTYSKISGNCFSMNVDRYDENNVYKTWLSLIDN